MANRTKEIKGMFPIPYWNHCPTARKNPAVVTLFQHSLQKRRLEFTVSLASLDTVRYLNWWVLRPMSYNFSATYANVNRNMRDLYLPKNDIMPFKNGLGPVKL